MESLVQLRQMMAEQKFVEAQRAVEVLLQTTADHRRDLLLLYHEALSAQERKLPPLLALELAHLEIEMSHFDQAVELASSVSDSRFLIEVERIHILCAEARGKMNVLYDLIATFLIHQFEKQKPFIPTWVNDKIEKYFKTDFNLQLKLMAINLQRGDLESAELLARELITATIERSSTRGSADRLLAIRDVLLPYSKGNSLDIYEKFCWTWVHGIGEKSEFKRIIEMILYFEDFKFHSYVLHLLHASGRTEEAMSWAETIRTLKGYSYVYFDKYLPHLKQYFFKKQKPLRAEAQEASVPDLNLTEKYSSSILSDPFEAEDDELESNILFALKYQNCTPSELCDLAVGFLQAEMPRAALMTSNLAREKAEDNKAWLKASYLRLHSQLLLKDYRAAVDTALEALTKADSRDDVLSFLYGQAEAYIRLGQKKDAKIILSQIISIDAGYRLAKERLEKL